MSIVAHQQHQRVSKTGENDVYIPLDLPRHHMLTILLQQVVRSTTPGTALWPFEYEHLRLTFLEAVRECELKPIGLTLHCLRHGGASHDMLVKARSIEGVRSRGSWKSHSSVKRYEKCGTIGVQLKKLRVGVLQKLHKAETKLEGSWRKLFAPLFERHEAMRTLYGAAAKSTSTSLADQQLLPKRCESLVTRSSSSTATPASTMTFRTLRPSTHSSCGLTPGGLQPLGVPHPAAASPRVAELQRGPRCRGKSDRNRSQEASEISVKRTLTRSPLGTY